MSTSTSKIVGGPGFQDLIFHGLHEVQPLAHLGVKTYKARPSDDSMQIAMDLKGTLLTFPIGHVIGKFNPRTGDMIQSEEMLKMLGDDMVTKTDDLVNPLNVEHGSIFK